MTHLRIARPTDDIEALLPFYRDGLGFGVLSQFTDHAGFDGVMLGWTGAAFHLEFTHKRGHPVGRAPTRDNLLVLYLPDPNAWRTAIDRMKGAGHMPVPAFNPYWDQAGATFEDPDGYRVVIEGREWALIYGRNVR
mgnify:FL=1